MIPPALPAAAAPSGARHTGDAPPSRELPEGYYVDNFSVVLDTVEQRYGDLLSAQERGLIDRFHGLGAGARRLYVRLIMRKGPCFRVDRLSYREIPRLDEALAELTDAGLLDAGEGLAPEALWSLLLREELLVLLRELELEAKDPRRAAAEETLRGAEASGRGEEIEAAVRRRLEIVHPLGEEVLLAIRLMFFGNPYQDWTEFVLRDLGIVRYEDYPLHREQRLFSDRRSVDQALEMCLARTRLGLLLAAGDLDGAGDLASWAGAGPDGQGGAWLGRAGRDAQRILVTAARAFERAGRAEASLELYAAASVPPAKERRCRVLAKLGRLEEALELCRRLEKEPQDETEAAFAPFFAHRLRRQLGLTRAPWKRPKRPVESLEIEADGLAAPRRSSAEALALEALSARGRRGIYSENWLWRGLFGLAFWDIIFAPLPGVFAHPFQLGPLDLQTPHFRRARKDVLEARLEELRTETDLRSRLEETYHLKAGVANALVTWHPSLEPSWDLAFGHVGGEALATISDRLSRDLGRHRRGLPDLLVLDESSPVGFELLEVKAPGDQLRPEQGAWIDYLNAHGVPAKVLKLVPTPSGEETGS